MVILQAEHMCMTMRGIKKPGSQTMTYVCRGAFENNPFVETVQEHIKAKTALGDELIERLKNI